MARQFRASNGVINKAIEMLFDHLVGAGKQRGRNIQTNGLCRFQIYEQLGLC